VGAPLGPRRTKLETTSFLTPTLTAPTEKPAPRRAPEALEALAAEQA